MISHAAWRIILWNNQVGFKDNLMKKQQIIILIVAAVMFGGFFFAAYLPLCAKRKAVRERREMIELVIKKMREEGRQIPMMEIQLESLRKDEKNYRRDMPESMDLGPFLNTIAQLMSENNLKDQSVKPGNEVKLGSLGCIPVEIKFKGRIVQVFEFFKSLQRLDRAVRIVLVNIVNDNALTGDLTAQTKAVIYYKAQKTKG